MRIPYNIRKAALLKIKICMAHSSDILKLLKTVDFKEFQPQKNTSNYCSN